MGLVNLEALSCGLPDIASRIGGIPEFVAENRNGFLFTPGNHHELAEQIRRLYNDTSCDIRWASKLDRLPWRTIQGIA